MKFENLHPKSILAWCRTHLEAIALWTSAILVLALFPLVFLVYPTLFIGPVQPIPFSHGLHAGVKGIECRFCHPTVERSARAGIPEVGKCLFCHEHIIPGHPQIERIRDHHSRGMPIQWVRVTYLPDHVSFSHMPHIMADLECAECHGKVEQMDRIPSEDFKMGRCVECHRRKSADLGCWLACHR
ncbi:MAG: cytochrome c3 family protein [Planctomycetota bacterium]|jgi:hypothetical protein